MSAKDQLLIQYDLHTTLFNNVLVDINEEEAEVRLAPGINHVKWLAGHLVWGQLGLARMGNVQVDIPWTDHFNTQLTEPVSASIKMPSLEEIKAEWNKYTGPIREGLEQMPEEALNSPIEFPLPAFKTTESLWTFINHHQAYTIGQIGILRRALGKEAMKYR
ncbi:DinB family protein [Mucilaginibacter gotjawali]|uniref:Uncharacterized protein n=2 Tax=Mucilaginibacter gotjawali TaxID=1550579 RepID=A0A839SK45_9SPHI|nr:DinB family protein [Mucilaginibacter gotjawali]MBB3058246.1 hypothetical protein [Mucilaginibacter gotjawali]BAU54798.1 DinB superfamily protein [Mucilaginibacter gotjawali]